MTPIQKAILEYIKQKEPSSPDGVRVDAVAFHINVEWRTAKDFLEELHSLGYLYCPALDHYLVCLL